MAEVRQDPQLTGAKWNPKTMWPWEHRCPILGHWLQGSWITLPRSPSWSVGTVGRDMIEHTLGQAYMFLGLLKVISQYIPAMKSQKLLIQHGCFSIMLLFEAFCGAPEWLLSGVVRALTGFDLGPPSDWSRHVPFAFSQHFSIFWYILASTFGSLTFKAHGLKSMYPAGGLQPKNPRPSFHWPWVSASWPPGTGIASSCPWNAARRASWPGTPCWACRSPAPPGSSLPRRWGRRWNVARSRP